jgi:pyruvate-ferredoxin/flavodoxin oxidoreductase
LAREKPKTFWTVGINDDVTFTSLPVKYYGYKTASEGSRNVINWGFGGDGSVGAMTSTARLVAERTPNYV